MAQVSLACLLRVEDRSSETWVEMAARADAELLAARSLVFCDFFALGYAGFREMGQRVSASCLVALGAVIGSFFHREHPPFSPLT